ncbi:MAG: pyruvate dehydrogenase [Ignavibacteria bacterium]|nr:pyruvate dehydrogenase [Ignavibacteria bacterium]
MTKADWIFTAKTLLTSRLIDTIEETELAPSGKVLYQFSSRGHELAQILLAVHLDGKHDAATVYYRSRPFVLAAGMTIEEAFSGPMAKSGSRNGGRDIGVVHNLTPRNGITVLPASGDVGAQYTPAVGWAQGADYRANVLNEKQWKSSCAVALGGDASVATSGFWAALTIATTKNYPMIFFIEDNNYGISVPGTYQTPGANIAENLASFKNLLILDGDGTDPEEASLLIKQAVDTVRKRQSPVLLRLKVPRLCGHSGADNQSYKPLETKESEINTDPLPRLKTFLQKKKILSAKDWTNLEAEVTIEVRQGLDRAVNQSEPDVSTTKNHLVYDGMNAQIVGGLLPEITISTISQDESEGPRINLIHAVRLTLEQELKVNNRVMVFGEDVGVKGGVHGATVDLQTKFGDDRVFDTSLSEEGIIGRTIGLAFAGLMPVPEIQFRKYLDPAMEQINDTGTIRWRTNNQFAAPMVVRIPVGHSKRTGDPWHSVSGEAIFAHTLGWKIAMPSNARDAVGLLRTALRGNDPTFFLEHRNLLDTSAGRSIYPGNNFMIPFGVANVIETGTKVTIVTWGEMVHRAKDAVSALGESIEIIDLRTIAPWDKLTVIDSIKKTNRCMILHEDTITSGFGAEIAAIIAKEAFSYLDAPIERVATPDVPIPYNLKMMDVIIPTNEIIIDRLEYLINF